MLKNIVIVLCIKNVSEYFSSEWGTTNRRVSAERYTFCSSSIRWIKKGFITILKFSILMKVNSNLSGL